MISREQVKLEIDSLQEIYLNFLYRIIQVLKFLQGGDRPSQKSRDVNPLRNSVIFEDDLVSPIGAELTLGEGDRQKQIQGASMTFNKIRDEVTSLSPGVVGLSIREAIEEGRRF